MRILSLLVLPALLSAIVIAQDENEPTEKPEPRPIPPVISAMQAPIKPQAHVLKDATPVTLRLVSGIKVKEANPGDVANFVLDHDLWYGNLLIAKEGVPVQAVVVEASKAKWLSRGSKLGIDIRGFRLLNGQTVALRGTPNFHGGVGLAAGVSTALGEADKAFTGPDRCLLCELVYAPAATTDMMASRAALASMAGPGSNKDVAPNTVATAWVDGDILLDKESFRPFQAKADAGPARVRVVRGELGSVGKRDLYCNGVPMAFLHGRHKIELDLEPGWYRFAIGPKKDSLELFLAAGSLTKLITDARYVYEIDRFPNDKNGWPIESADRLANTRVGSFRAKQKTESEYLELAQPVDDADRYPTQCHPLEEVTEKQE